MRILTILTLVATALVAHSETIGWHPDLQGIRLGRGVDLRDQGSTKGFVATMGTNNTPGGSGSSFDLGVRYVQDSFDMAQSFSLNTSLSVRSKVFSGSVGYSSAEGVSSTGNSVSFAMDGGRALNDELYPVIALTPDFSNTVATLRQTLSGAALEKELARLYGTHYVSGVRRAFKAVMVYTFTFQSQASARSQSLSVSAAYRGGVSRASFTADVASIFARKDSKFTLSYQFRSSNPISPPPPFATNSVITDLSQFTVISDLFENYCRTNDLSFAIPVSFTVERFQNLPGFQALVGNYTPASILQPDYGFFMQTYAEFAGWQEILNYWTGGAERMNWLNTNGQRMVTTMRGEVGTFIESMKNSARSHFTNGTPLEVSADIINYRANLAQIPVPRLVVWQRVFRDGGGLWLGYVNAGPRELTVANPIQSVSLTYQGNEYNNEPPIYYSASDFKAYLDSFSFSQFDLDQFKNPGFQGPRWAGILAATNVYRIGFFYGGASTYFGSQMDFNQAAWIIKSAANQIVDSLPVFESRTDQLSLSSNPNPTGDLRLVQIRSSSPSAVGQSQLLEFYVTNAGPGSVYGAEVTVPVPSGVELASATTSQGYAFEDGANLRFRVGALAVGSSATLRLRLTPLKTGTSGGIGLMSLSLAPELSDPDSSNNQLAAPTIEAATPRLDISRQGSLVQLRWQSETDRLLVEESSTVSTNTSWSTSTNTVSTLGSTRTMETEPSTPARFYRLRVQ